MALDRIKFNIASFNDVDAGGNNYYAGIVYEVFNSNDTLADIYSDAAGANPINQDGISNKSSAIGEVVFYIDSGDYYIKVNEKVEYFSTLLSSGALINKLSQALEVDIVNDATTSVVDLPVGKRITTAGNITKNDNGAANWEVVLTSSVTPNGTYIRQLTTFPLKSLVYRPLDSLVNIDCFRSAAISDDLNILAGIELAKSMTAKTVMCTGEWSIPIPNRSSSGFSSFMTFNYSMLIDGYNGEIDFTSANFTLQTNSISDARMTMFVTLNCSCTFKLPFVDGQLSQQFMGTSYIDDCVLRIGGGCRDMSVIADSDLINFGGHGIVVRNYGTQDGFADVESGVPVNIRLTGKGTINGMWQSGVVPITGYDVVVKDMKVTFSGNNNNINSQQGTTGHNFHQEAVSNGTNDPFIKDVTFKDCTAEDARIHGFMIHTAINNTRISGGWSRRSGSNGARYEGFCQSLDVDGLVCEDNVGDGEYISLSTANWLGSEGKDVIATIRSTCIRNGGVGKRDNSGGLSLQISGYSAYNQRHGVILAQAVLPNIRQLLRDLVVSNNCADMEPGYGIFTESALMDNVRIVNQDKTKYNQTPLNFNGDQPEASSLVIDGDLPTGYEFDNTLAVELPVGGKGLRLYGSYATILNDRILFTPFSSGVYNLPKGYRYYRIDRKSGTSPLIKVEAMTPMIVGEIFEIDYVGVASNIELRTRDGVGTINGVAQPFLMQANTRYEIEYEAATNMLVTVIA